MLSIKKTNPEPALPSLGAVLSNQKRLIAAVFLVVFTTIAAVTVMLPKRYESTMKVLVKKERVDPVVTPGHTPENQQVGDVTEADLNSEVELLKSTDILRPVVLQCGLANKEVTGVQAAGATSPIAQEKALRRLQKELQVSSIRKSNIIHVSYLATDPKTAAQVLRQLADNYLTSHLALHGAPGTYEFFHAQVAEHEKELADSESALRLFAQKKGLFVIDEQKDLLLRQIAEAQTLSASLAAQIHSDNERIAQARTNLAGLAPRIVTVSRTVPNQASVEKLHTMLAELHNKRTDMASKFRLDDRNVVDLDKQIADTQASLDRAMKLQATEQATDVNPLAQELESDRAKAELDRAAAKARAASVQFALSNYQSKLAGLTSSTNEYDTLVRRAAEAKQTYLLYRQKEEEARVADSLDHQKIANVAIAETPREAVLPSSPNVPVTLGMGFVFALFLSIGVAWTAQAYSTKGELSHA